ncbi:MAG: ATP-binding cassette domain-containing protein [Proteobacteria bacterium]|jgi:ATP-binding cassette, subfamily B, bacterial|nr:ATP-binding cassette domain-containing protein [Pseudomonadota bacterium]
MTQNARDIDRPKGKNLAELKPIFEFIKPYKKQVFLALLFLLLAASTTLALGRGIQYLVDNGFAGGNSALLTQALGALGIIIVVNAISTAFRFYFVSWIGERVNADIREAVFSHVLSLSPGFFETTKTGEILSRITADTTVLESMIGSSVSIALRNAFIMVGGLVMLAITSLKLTGMILLVVPLVIGPIVFFGRRVRQFSRESQDRVADIGAYADEALHGIRTVQAFSHEDQDRAHFKKEVERSFQAARRRISQRAVLTGIVILLVFAAIGSVLWIGGNDVVQGRMSVGELSAFLFYSVLVAGSVGALSEVMTSLQRAAGAAERLMELLATEADIKAPQNPIALTDPARGEIEFKDVTFFYPSRPGHVALKNLSLHIQPGEQIAIVGPSGAGKTTLYQLLLRFYDPKSGKVLLDGVDLMSADPRKIRDQLGIVSQEPVIFATSALENIRYGKPDASDAQVRAAAAAAHALEFIEKLPQGFDSNLGERGVLLSGGQKQRIAIARAILRDPVVLLLDEATSALDAESERLVQQALERLMKDRTTLVIAHRLATVKKADRIIVISDGEIIDSGTHNELIKQRGLYAQLAELQFAA